MWTLTRTVLRLHNAFGSHLNEIDLVGQLPRSRAGVGPGPRTTAGGLGASACRPRSLCWAMHWALSLSFPCAYSDEHRRQAKSATPRKYECGTIAHLSSSSTWRPRNVFETLCRHRQIFTSASASTGGKAGQRQTMKEEGESEIPADNAASFARVIGSK